MNDKMILKGMRFYGRHGCLPEELALGQWFEVDLEMTLDLTRAGESDDLRDTLNYAEIYDRFKSVVEGYSFALIEALAVRLIETCFVYGQVEHVRILLKKPQAPLGGPLDYAAVEIARSRRDMKRRLGKSIQRPGKKMQAAPEAKQAAPEAKQAAPEAKQAAPEAKQAAPEAKQAAPEAKQAAPEAKQTAPEAKKTAPKAKKTAPGKPKKKPAGQ